MYADIVLIRTLTNVHVGVGSSGGIVDLPVQRDELGFPCIYSSSIKGALKTSLLQAFIGKHKNYAVARNAVSALLGPDPEEGESFESSVAVLDAYLLAAPVRSLRGVYAYVTSPILLRKFLERADLCSKLGRRVNEQDGNNFTSVRLLKAVEKLAKRAENISRDEAICVGDCKRVVMDQPEALRGKVLLSEEFLLNIDSKAESMGQEVNLLYLLEVFRLDRPLLVLNDDTAREVINRSLVRLARIRLRREKKTVEAGPWTEEYVPVNTVFHTVFFYKRPPLTASFIGKILGKESNEVDDEAYLEALERLGILRKGDLEELGKMLGTPEGVATLVEKVKESFWDVIDSALKNFIIMGGKETIGKGIVELRRLIPEKEEG